MVDIGFTIEKDLPCGVKLVIPSFKGTDNNKLTTTYGKRAIEFKGHPWDLSSDNNCTNLLLPTTKGRKII